MPELQFIRSVKKDRIHYLNPEQIVEADFQAAKKSKAAKLTLTMSNGSEKKYSGAEAEEINNYLNTHVLQLENNLEIVRSFDVDEENK